MLRRCTHNKFGFLAFSCWSVSLPLSSPRLPCRSWLNPASLHGSRLRSCMRCSWPPTRTRLSAWSSRFDPPSTALLGAFRCLSYQYCGPRFLIWLSYHIHHMHLKFTSLNDVGDYLGLHITVATDSRSVGPSSRLVTCLFRRSSHSFQTSESNEDMKTHNYSRGQKVAICSSSNPRPKTEGQPAKISLHPCSNRAPT